MTLVVDTDALVLMVALGAMDDLCAVIGVRREELLVLSAARAQVRRAKWVGDQFPQLDRELAGQLIAGLAIVPLSSNTALLDRLNDVDGIDEGEAILLAYLCENSEAVLLTGDTRSMRALAKAAELADVRAQVHGRIILLPPFLRRLAQHATVEVVRERWVAYTSTSRTLMLIFGSRATAPPDDIDRGVESLIGDATGAHLAGFFRDP